MKKGTYLEEVRNQYENYPYPYPYPARDPQDEKGFLLSSKPSSLDCINYFCFGGERDFSKPFRVLIAGGGTGDCTIYLAEQLRDTPAEIVYLPVVHYDSTTLILFILLPLLTLSHWINVSAAIFVVSLRAKPVKVFA